MGREVRKVPANWVHPKDENGRYIPLNPGGRFEDADAEWQIGYSNWQNGLCGWSGNWKPIEEEYKHMRYTEYSGPRPSPDYYMPVWTDDVATHFMMYEDTSEGTPISPAFETPEQLARWLADTGASSLGCYTATYEQWLRVCLGGYAPSAVYMPETGLVSGVAAL